MKLKLGKVTRTSVVVTLTSAEKFAFTGKATLFAPGKKGKAQSKVASFSLGKPAKLTLKLKSKLRAGQEGQARAAAGPGGREDEEDGRPDGHPEGVGYG